MTIRGAGDWTRHDRGRFDVVSAVPTVFTEYPVLCRGFWGKRGGGVEGPACRGVWSESALPSISAATRCLIGTRGTWGGPGPGLGRSLQAGYGREPLPQVARAATFSYLMTEYGVLATPFGGQGRIVPRLHSHLDATQSFPLLRPSFLLPSPGKAAGDGIVTDTLKVLTATVPHGRQAVADANGMHPGDGTRYG